MGGSKRHCFAIRVNLAQRRADAQRKHQETGVAVQGVKLERPVTVIFRVLAQASQQGMLRAMKEGRDGMSMQGEQIPQNGDSSL
jgi:hypothetical protein